MILFNKLPEEIESYILWLSVGGKDLDIYKKKKNVNTEINLYKKFKQQYPNIGGVYLKPISDYKKIPELESMEYIYGSRWLLSEYGITKRKHRSQL